MLRPTGEPRLVAAAWDTPAPGARRAMPVNLVIVFAFALAALVLLARVLVSAAQIDNNVAAALNPAVVAVESDTTMLNRLDGTVVATGQLSESVSAFDTDLGSAAKATAQMRTLGRSTDESVDQIQGSVAGINTSVAGIKKSVTSMGSSVRGVEQSSASIRRQFDGTHTQARAIVADLDASNSSVAQILNILRDLDPVLGRINTTLVSFDKHSRNLEENGLIKLGNLLPDLLSGLAIGDLALGGSR